MQFGIFWYIVTDLVTRNVLQQTPVSPVQIDYRFTARCLIRHVVTGYLGGLRRREQGQAEYQSGARTRLPNAVKRGHPIHLRLPRCHHMLHRRTELHGRGYDRRRSNRGQSALQGDAMLERHKP